jgi:hypothetical protein
VGGGEGRVWYVICVCDVHATREEVGGEEKQGVGGICERGGEV